MRRCLAECNARCNACGNLFRADLDSRDPQDGPPYCQTCNSYDLYPYEPEQGEPTGTNAKGWED